MTAENNVLRRAKKLQGLGETSRAENTMDLREKIIDRYKKFLESRFGRYVFEYTDIIRNIAQPEATGMKICLIPILMTIAGSVLFLMRRFAFGIPLLAAGLAATLTGCLFWWAYSGDEQRHKDDLLTRKGILGQHSAAKELSARAVSKTADHAMPTFRRLWKEAGHGKEPIPARYYGTRIGISHGVGIWADCEQSLYVLGPQKCGKTTTMVIPMIMEAPGAVIATSSRRDIVDATYRHRKNGWQDKSRFQYDPQKKGGWLTGHKADCWIFDPMDVAAAAAQTDEDRPELPPRLVWNPVTRCINETIAFRCAAALVATAETGSENGIWAHAGTNIVQAMLHAAALENLSMREVYEWSVSIENCQNAAKILQQHPESPVAANWAQHILTLKTENHRTSSSKMLVVTSALQAFQLPQVIESVCPGPDEEEFDIKQFIESTGTVYLLGELRPVQGTAAATAGALTAMFLTQVRDEARKLAAAQEGGRLQPPLSLILDEIANIEPWSELPSLFTAGTGEGIWAAIFTQSRKLMKAAYHDGPEGQMWDSSTKIIFGGLGEPEECRGISEMCGMRTLRRTEESWSKTGLLETSTHTSKNERTERIPVLSADEVREIPRQKMTLMLQTSHKPVLMETIPYWQRPYEPLDD